jgi:demethylmenaquinone methyltransferase/2-methoxy-6-polyprenyl-1,4-benzoquinol methylase
VTDWDELLGEQIAYYEARAPEYDQGWSREGRYDLGAEFNRVWLAEADRLHAVFDQFAPRGDVLELAAGTGIWTTQIARYASSITAVDTSSEALAINAAKLASSTIPVRYI